MTKEYIIFAKTNDEAYYLIGYDSKKDATYQRRFETIVDLINFAIQDSWEKDKEGFSFKSAAFFPLDLQSQLPKQEYDLIKRVVDAYQDLERNLEQMEDINHRMKTTLARAEKYLEQERETRKKLEQQGK